MTLCQLLFCVAFIAAIFGVLWGIVFLLALFVGEYPIIGEAIAIVITLSVPCFLLWCIGSFIVFLFKDNLES